MVNYRSAFEHLSNFVQCPRRIRLRYQHISAINIHDIKKRRMVMNGRQSYREVQIAQRY
jgi:phosphotransferase system IIB component